MIRGVCGHIWEAPGQSAIILQLNLDRHEEIFSLPSSSSITSPKLMKRLKSKPDKTTPIVVRVSVSAPSFEEMPQSIQLWQSKGTDDQSMHERISILPRIEVFNNSFCVVTVLYRDHGYLLVGMAGNLKRVSPSGPCKHNVIVSVEPAISDGRGGEPQLHPLTNLTSHPSRSASNNNNNDNANIAHHNQSHTPPPPPPDRPPNVDHRKQHRDMESAFVSPPRQLEPSFSPSTVEVVKNKGANFFHMTRKPASSNNNENLNNNSSNKPSGVYVTMPSPNEMMATNSANNNPSLISAGENSSNNTMMKSKEDTEALHHRRADYAASKQRYGFISPAVPEDLRFRQPVNGSMIPSPSRFSRNRNDDAPFSSEMLPVPLPPHSSFSPSSGPRSHSGILLNQEEGTQTLKVEGLIGSKEDNENNNNNNNNQGSSNSPPPPPPPPAEDDELMETARGNNNNSPFSKSISAEEFFSVFCRRFKDWNEQLEDLALTYAAKQGRFFQSSYASVVPGSS